MLLPVLPKDPFRLFLCWKWRIGLVLLMWFWVGGLDGYASGKVVKGVADLRGVVWDDHSTWLNYVELEGEWRFLMNDYIRRTDSFLALGYKVRALTDRPDFRNVPGLSGWFEDGRNSGIEDLEIELLLDSSGIQPLGIEIQECMTAYQIWIDGQPMGGRGKINKTFRPEIPGFGHRIFPLPMGRPRVTVRIQIANLFHRRMGLMFPPKVGTLKNLADHHTVWALIGAVAIGMALLNALFQLFRFFRNRKDWASFYHAGWSGMVVIHFLCLHERWLYVLLGDWESKYVYRLELLSLLAMAFSFLNFMRTFLRVSWGKWLHRAVLIALGLEFLWFTIVGVQFLWVLDAILPYQLLVLFAYLFFQLYLGWKGNAPSVLWIFLSTTALLAALFIDHGLWGLHVGKLQLFHYLSVVFILGLSWEMVRQSRRNEQEVIRLSKDLATSNIELEKYNDRLEKEVESRTLELMEARQMAHELEMGQIRKDTEAVVTHNLMKVQLIQEMIEELEGLKTARGDENGGLRGLIANLRGQLDADQRLTILQADLQTVNADFHNRLHQKYPQLSKTEREICAYIKLNMSTKDIALIRKTTVNTLNVTRHRIRKKMGLERDEELVAALGEV